MNVGNLVVGIVWSAANLPLSHAGRMFRFLTNAEAVHVAELSGESARVGN
jgi:hypothetical protein